MNRTDVLNHLRSVLEGNGLKSDGPTFRHESKELLWIVDLERVPRTSRVGITVGVCPVVLGTVPRRGNDCPIVFYPENGGEPFGIDRDRVWRALDGSYDVTDEVRADTLTELAKSIADLAHRVTTLADLKRLSSSGQLRAAIRKDARDLLKD